MNRFGRLGYVPVCSSSSVSRTCKKVCLRDYCALFQRISEEYCH